MSEREARDWSHRIQYAIYEGHKNGVRFEDAVIHVHPMVLDEIIISSKPYYPVFTAQQTIFGVNYVVDVDVEGIVIRWEVKV